MIIGTVNARRELVVRLEILDILDQPRDIDVIVDTGFTGIMTLPPPLVASLGLLKHSRVPMAQADGSLIYIDVYYAVLVWDGNAQYILVHAVGPDALLGTGLLVGHDLRARVEPGGTVEIEAIPP